MSPAALRRGKWAVLVLWLVALGALAPLAGKLSGALKNDATAYLPPQAESTKVNNQVQDFLGKTIPTAVVYHRSGGLTRADRNTIAADRAAVVTDVLHGGRAAPVQVSRDGTAALLAFDVPASSNGTVLQHTIEHLRTLAERGADGMTVKVSGAGGQLLDSLAAFNGIDSTLLFATVAVVAVILLITYRSPVLWLLPLIAVGVANEISQGVVYLLAHDAGLTVNSQTEGILTVLVFGAGTDYALLLVARYREELHRHADRHEAMALALRRAGPAIFASGATVIVSLLCLLAAQLNSDRGLGPVCAVGIACALLAELTLLPALLLAGGRWMFWPFRPVAGTPTDEHERFWGRVGRRIERRPRMVWGATGLVLAAVAVGMVQLNANGLTTAQSFRGHPDSVVGQQIIQAHFAAGASDPAFLVTDVAQARTVATRAAATRGVRSVAIAAPPRAGRLLLLVTLTDPPDGHAAEATIDRLRAVVHAVPGAHAQVGGSTATNLDVRRSAVHDRDLIIPVVLVVVLVVLGVLLRAVVAPLMLIATVVLSFAAALGGSALVSRHLLGFAGTDPATPLYAFIFLVALGIDYNIFLMTRVREEASRSGTRAGTLTGLAVTGGVITSAGFVLAATFSVLAVLPLVVLTEIGFTVAFGVLLDTLVVRSILVPALTLDIGGRVWWPSRLGRRPDPTPPVTVGTPVG